MTTPILVSVVPKTYARVLSIAVLSLCVFTLSACQKDPESEATVETPVNIDVQTIDVSTVNKATESAALESKNTGIEREITLTEPDIVSDTVTTETTTPSPEQNIKGTQVTDVEYRSATGATISVVFETSATGVLNAIVTLPNKTKMILSAPEGQGNNPTYRSTDGSVELVSHGGGGTIDLMQNNQVTNFEAISVEAEVVTQS